METKSCMPALRVAYVTDHDYTQLCNKLPRVPARAGIVHCLIEAYGLLKHMRLISPYRATDKDLRMFHSPEYIECLQEIGKHYDDERMTDKMKEFGLEFDCPIIEDLYSLVCYIAGGSLSAANCIITASVDIAINWNGGWHHAKRDEAAGYCYVNDVVLCLLKLREKFSRVLYVDLDLHHGDGVEDAFCATRKVLTVSFHKHCDGFFPGSGMLKDIGVGKGKFYSVNVPLKDGIDDAMFISIFTRVMSMVLTQFQPQAIVCQCGADGISGDPMSSFNLTPQALSACVRYVMSHSIPMVLLGGGGYNFPNTARCWASLTATALGLSLPPDIPEHKYFTKYGPGFDTEVSPGCVRNINNHVDIEEMLSQITDHLEHVTAHD